MRRHSQQAWKSERGKARLRADYCKSQIHCVLHVQNHGALFIYNHVPHLSHPPFKSTCYKECARKFAIHLHARRHIHFITLYVHTEWKKNRVSDCEKRDLNEEKRVRQKAERMLERDEPLLKFSLSVSSEQWQRKSCRNRERSFLKHFQRNQHKKSSVLTRIHPTFAYLCRSDYVCVCVCLCIKIHSNTILHKKNNVKTDCDYERCGELECGWQARERKRILESSVLCVLSSGRRYTML